ncbi:MAG: nucleoside-triphosphatase [Candidatus Nanohaloarchaeota archaeon QJJ-9]|nr:nucleoside-triphosphatase [Candidatus Nanohaloarchaeota archaeon QJJ-9]
MVNVLLTGKDGVGKTEMVQEVVEDLDKSYGGVVSPREGASHLVKDLETGETEVLEDSKDPKNDSRVVKFYIDAISSAVDIEAVIVIDMVSKLEMYSSDLREIFRNCLISGRDVLMVLEPSYVDEFEEIGEVFRLVEDNRDEVREEIVSLLSG